MAEEERRFGTWDWVLFAAMLAVSASIGIFYAFKGNKQKTTGDYLMGGRKMQLFPVAISILVSFMSAILILGTPAEMYTQGTLYFVYLLGMIISIILSAQLFVPLLYPLKLTSSFEYIEKRFQSRAAKFTGTFIMIIQQIIYMGIASFAPSTALEAVTDFPVWATIITVGCVSTFYTFLGGMKAVVWTDVFQSVVMIAGLLAIMIQGAIKVGGLDDVWKINDQWGRIDFWEVDPDPRVRHSIWSLVVGGAVGWLGTYGVNQASVQRYCALPTLKKAKGADPDPTARQSVWSLVVGGAIGWMAWYGVNQASVQRYCALPSLQKAKGAVMLNIAGVIILLTVTCLCGIVMFAYYALKGCDPLSNDDVANPNQLIPYFVMEILAYPGLPGLFIACLFSGALSSVSSSLNALSAVTWEDILKPSFGEKVSETGKTWVTRILAVTWEDILKPSFGEKVSETGKTWVTRILVVFYGIAGIGFAFMAQNLGGTVLEASLSFTGAASGPLLGIFFLGSLFPWANWIGCVVGGFLGLALPLWISIGAYSLPSKSYKLAFPTHNCSVYDYNITMTTITSSYDVTTNMTMASPTTAAPTELTGIQSLYTISYLWYPSIGMATVVIVGLLVSFITGPMSMDEVDPKYLMPFFDRLLCCLPEGILRKLRCNLPFRDPEEILHDEKDEEIVIPQMEQQTSFGNTKVKYIPTVENGIAMLSYDQKDKHKANDNRGFETEGFDNIRLQDNQLPPSYAQLSDYESR